MVVIDFDDGDEDRLGGRLVRCIGGGRHRSVAR